MSLSIADQYYLKARDEYRYNQEAFLENITYALGYDAEHAGANYLMGLMYWEYFGEFERAEEYFQQVLANDPKHLGSCRAYSQLLIEWGKFEKAEKLIRYSYTLAGVNKGIMLSKEGLLLEFQKKYKEAIKVYKLALKESYSQGVTDYLNGIIERVKKKHKPKRKKKKSNKRKKSKKSKKKNA